MTRRTFIDSDHAELSITRQCELVGLARSRFYYKPATESQDNLIYMRLMDVLYTARALSGFAPDGSSLDTPSRPPPEPQAYTATYDTDGYRKRVAETRLKQART